MHIWAKRMLAVGAALLLTGCLWGPGKFASDLVLKAFAKPIPISSIGIS